MKKKLESELISIAHRILKLKGKEDINKLHAEVSQLYEKITVLKFAENNFEENMPTIGNDSSFFGMLDQAFNNKISDTIEFEDQLFMNSKTDNREDIAKPLIEQIKNMLEYMPESSTNKETILAKLTPKETFEKNDLEEITADFAEMPVFEPLEKVEGKKSLNDTLKNDTFSIDLNDKLAFINSLFEGKAEDYERVLSQLNTVSSLNEAIKLIQEMVKPEYNNWEGKEAIETRFMAIIENKFT